jgi:hypothetical protein
MHWIMGAAVLFGMGVLLRRLLGLGASSPRRLPMSLNHEQRSFCNAIAEEVESRSAILAVLLNEAIEELAAGNSDIAWELLDLAKAEWISLAEFLSEILRNVTDYLPLAHIAIPVRSMVAEHFRSDVMIDYLRVPELVDQFLSRTKLRFHVQIRVLRHAVEILTTDFRRAEPTRNLGTAYSRALWSRLDRDYHDFDLIAKRTVLASGRFVSWLPQSAAALFVLALRPALERGVRCAVRQKSRTAAWQ